MGKIAIIIIKEGSLMRKFSILHLSDLHIISYRNSYPNVYKKLIDDIVNETQKIDSLILVVTGDIIDKAKYEKHENAAIDFFYDLKIKLKDKIKRIYFTPGNHDKNRVGCDKFMQEYFNNLTYNELFDKFENGDWKNLFCHPFDDYSNFIKKISEKLNVEIITDLYYCDMFEINDCLIRINSINSSLTSFNDYDYGSLHIGKFQIDKIERDYEEKKKGFLENPVDVSITIMHHPTFWLCKEEYDEIQHSISSHDSLSTDVLLRGHTHDRSLENYYSLYNSFSTLVTGIGSSNNDKDHPQRYSIYTFMCDLNLIEIIMKSSSEKGFIPDYSAYVNKTDESRKKIHFPMHVHDFFSDIYLKLPLVENDFQPIFPTKNIFKNMTDYSGKLLKLKEDLTNILFTYKQEFIGYLMSEEYADADCDYKDIFEKISKLESYLLKQGVVEITDDELDYIQKTLKEHQDKILEYVNGLLYEACCLITDVFFSNSLNSDEQVRTQFRVFNSKTRSHEGLTNQALKGNVPISQHDITPVPWGNGLIKQSFKTNTPLIYSLNKDSVTDRMDETSWKDYITYAPNIATNSYYHSRYKTNYPVLTFGINCSFAECGLFFEVLSLLPIKEIIDDFLMDIHDSFEFSFESLIRK